MQIIIRFILLRRCEELLQVVKKFCLKFEVHSDKNIFIGLFPVKIHDKRRRSHNVAHTTSLTQRRSHNVVHTTSLTQRIFIKLCWV